MSQFLTKLLRRVIMSRAQRKCCEWQDAGKPLPPPHPVKKMILKEYASQFNLKVLVETGTYKGDMIFALRNSFDTLYTIELGMDLYEQAKQRFAKYPHVHLLQGDSGEVLKDLLVQIKLPTLFWLDGHYSAGVTARGELTSPIQKEIEHIARHPLAAKHVLLIDDARLFVGKEDYPTLTALEQMAKNNGFKKFSVSDDIIRIHN